MAIAPPPTRRTALSRGVRDPGDLAQRREAQPLVTSAPAAGTYEATVLADAPLAYWQLTEPGGLTAADSIGAYPLTFGGAETFRQPGLISDASTSIVFAGGYASGASTWAGPTRASLEAWVYYTGQPTSIANALNVWNNTGWVGFNASGFPEALFFLGTANVTAIGASTLALNTPHHLVATYDGAAVRIYVDGSEVINTPSTTAISWNANHSVGIAALTVGTPTNKFAGRVAHAAFYNYALTPTQVATHYSAGAGGVTRQGAAALATVDSSTAAAAVTYAGAATFATVDSSAAAAVITYAGAADLSTIEAMTVNGGLLLSGAAALSSVETLTAAAIETLAGAASLSSVETLTAAGIETLAGAAALSAVETMTVNGGLLLSDGAALSTVETMTAAGGLLTLGAAALATAEAMTAAGALRLGGTATLTTVTALTAAGVELLAGAAALATGETIAVAGVETLRGAVALTALMALTAAGTVSTGSTTKQGAADLFLAAVFTAAAGVVSPPPERRQTLRVEPSFWQ